MSSTMLLNEFLRKHISGLERDQVCHNLMLGILDRAQENSSDLKLWSLGEGAACAIQTPPNFIVLGDLDSQMCHVLANEVRGLEFAGCVGPGKVPEMFATSLKTFNQKLILGMPQRIYVLQTKPIYPKAIGFGRKFRIEDTERFVDWVTRFNLEANPHQLAPKRSEIEKMPLTRPVFFWEVEGKTVAMASRTRETKNGSNISLVYTPPEYRGQGYGGSVTAFACENISSEGKTLAFLYTDLRNPISNKIYQKIGFQPWCDASTFVKL